MSPFGIFARLFGASSGKTKIPTVKIDKSLVTTDVKTDLLKTISSLNEIPGEHVKTVYRIALSSIERGRDLHTFQSGIEHLKLDHLEKHEIAEIGLFLNNRATALIEKNRHLALGIERARWLYSGAPCTGSTLQDQLHQSLNGTEFDIADGVSVQGRPIWPGMERGCKCISMPNVPGFS